jgi:hypothetical protein
MQWSTFSSAMGRIGMLSAEADDDDKDQQTPAQEKSAGIHIVQNNSMAVDYLISKLLGRHQNGE